MAQQTFELIISQKQYEELKKSKANQVRLTQELAKLRVELTQRDTELGQYDKELRVKKEEVAYLSSLIKELGRVVQGQPPRVDQTGERTNSFQLLGQTIVNFQRKEREQEQIRLDLSSKFDTQIETVKKAWQKFQSQQSLISKLNELLSDKDTVLRQNGQRLFDEIAKQCKIPIKNISDIKKIVEEREIVKDIQVKYQSEKKKLLSQKQQFQNQLINLTSFVNQCSQKVRKLQKEKIENEKKIQKQKVEKIDSSISKGDKSYRLKLMIDEYIKSVQAGLQSISGLSELEIKEIVDSECNQIISYIPKAIKNRKSGISK